MSSQVQLVNKKDYKPAAKDVSHHATKRMDEQAQRTDSKAVKHTADVFRAQHQLMEEKELDKRIARISALMKKVKTRSPKDYKVMQRQFNSLKPLLRLAIESSGFRTAVSGLLKTLERVFVAKRSELKHGSDKVKSKSSSDKIKSKESSEKIKSKRSSDNIKREKQKTYGQQPGVQKYNQQQQQHQMGMGVQQPEFQQPHQMGLQQQPGIQQHQQIGMGGMQQGWQQQGLDQQGLQQQNLQQPLLSQQHQSGSQNWQPGMDQQYQSGLQNLQQPGMNQQLQFGGQNWQPGMDQQNLSQPGMGQQHTGGVHTDLGLRQQPHRAENAPQPPSAFPPTVVSPSQQAHSIDKKHTLESQLKKEVKSMDKKLDDKSDKKGEKKEHKEIKKEKLDESGKKIKKEKTVPTGPSGRVFTDKEWKKIEDGLHEFFTEVNSHPEYRKGVNNIFDLADTFSADIISSRDTKVVQELRRETRDLIAQFSGEDVLQRLFDNVEDLADMLDDNDEAHVWWHEFRRDFKRLCKNYHGREDLREARAHFDKVDRIFYKEDKKINKILHLLGDVFDNLKNDQYVDALRSKLSILGDDLYYTDTEGRKHFDLNAVRDITGALADILREELRNVDLPDVEGQDKRGTYSFRNIHVKTTLPSKIRFRVDSELADHKCPKTGKTEYRMNFVLRCRIKNIRSAAKNVDFAFNMKGINEAGVVDVAVPSASLYIDFVFRPAKNRDLIKDPTKLADPKTGQYKFIAVQSDFRIADIDINYHKDTLSHSFLVPLATKLFKRRLIKNLETSVERSINLQSEKMGASLAQTMSRSPNPISFGTGDKPKKLKSSDSSSESERKHTTTKEHKIDNKKESDKIRPQFSDEKVKVHKPMVQ